MPENVHAHTLASPQASQLARNLGCCCSGGVDRGVSGSSVLSIGAAVDAAFAAGESWMPAASRKLKSVAGLKRSSSSITCSRSPTSESSGMGRTGKRKRAKDTGRHKLLRQRQPAPLASGRSRKASLVEVRILDPYLQRTQETTSSAEKGVVGADFQHTPGGRSDTCIFPQTSLDASTLSKIYASNEGCFIASRRPPVNLQRWNLFPPPSCFLQSGSPTAAAYAVSATL
jgi:hypothetical protein